MTFRPLAGTPAARKKPSKAATHYWRKCFVIEPRSDPLDLAQAESRAQFVDRTTRHKHKFKNFGGL
jgi:hypothetical protein